MTQSVSVINVKKQQVFGGQPFGNLWVGDFQFSTTSGGLEASNPINTTQLGVGDKVFLGILPEGLLLLDTKVIVSTAFNGSVTCSLGFQYVNGVDSTVTPQNTSYFGSGLVLSSQAVLRDTAYNAPVKIAAPINNPPTFPQDGGDAYLVLTVAGASITQVGVLDVIVQGIMQGQ